MKTKYQLCVFIIRQYFLGLLIELVCTQTVTTISFYGSLIFIRKNNSIDCQLAIVFAPMEWDHNTQHTTFTKFKMKDQMVNASSEQ